MVKASPYIPQKGDIVWMNFSPQSGREQKGHRPALVVSSSTYNKWGLFLVCPITSQVKGYPFEVPIKTGKIEGCVLADHLKNQDWQARDVRFAGQAPAEVMLKVQEIIAALLVQ